ACIGDGLFFAEMNEVRNRHYECLTSVVNLLRDYATGTYAMGKGAGTVAANYNDADSLSHAKVQDVDKAMKPGMPGPSAHAMSSGSAPVPSGSDQVPSGSDQVPSGSDGGLTDKGVQ